MLNSRAHEQLEAGDPPASTLRDNADWFSSTSGGDGARRTGIPLGIPLLLRGERAYRWACRYFLSALIQRTGMCVVMPMVASKVAAFIAYRPLPLP